MTAYPMTFDDAVMQNLLGEWAILGELGTQVVGSGAAGTSEKFAPADHVHPLGSAAPSTIGTANAEGSDTTVSRTDHVHADRIDNSGIDGTGLTNSGTEPAPILDVDYGSVGSMESVDAGDSAAVGSGDAARVDHQHAVNTGAATTITDANSEGSSTDLARADHDHEYGTDSIDGTHIDWGTGAGQVDADLIPMATAVQGQSIVQDALEALETLATTGITWLEPVFWSTISEVLLDGGTGVGGVKASGRISFDGQPTAEQTFTGETGKVLTAKASGADPTVGEFDIAGTAELTAVNFVTTWNNATWAMTSTAEISAESNAFVNIRDDDLGAADFDFTNNLSNVTVIRNMRGGRDYADVVDGEAHINNEDQSGYIADIVSASITWTNFIISSPGDITAVVAGAGMTGGGTSGSVTLDVANADGTLTVTANDVKLSQSFDFQFDGAIDLLTGGEIDINSGAAIKINGTAYTGTGADWNILSGASAAGVAAADLQQLVDNDFDQNTVNFGAGGTVPSGQSFDIESGGELDINTGSTFNVKGSECTADGTELSILDGATVTTAEVNVLDGYSGDVNDLNILSGASGAGVAAADLQQLVDNNFDQNSVVLGAGGSVPTGQSVNFDSGSQLSIDGNWDIGGTNVTPVANDFNTLAGQAAYGLTAADLNKLADIDATAAEIDQVCDGVGATVTAANLTELTDNSETTLHSHPASSVPENRLQITGTGGTGGVNANRVGYQAADGTWLEADASDTGKVHTSGIFDAAIAQAASGTVIISGEVDGTLPGTHDAVAPGDLLILDDVAGGYVVPSSMYTPTANEAFVPIGLATEAVAANTGGLVGLILIAAAGAFKILGPGT